MLNLGWGSPKSRRCYNPDDMPTLQIVSTKPLSGKTTAAVALAQGFARDGQRVRLVRSGSGDAAVRAYVEVVVDWATAALTGVCGQLQLVQDRLGFE